MLKFSICANSQRCGFSLLLDLTNSNGNLASDVKDQSMGYPHSFRSLFMLGSLVRVAKFGFVEPAKDIVVSVLIFAFASAAVFAVGFTLPQIRICAFSV